MKKIYLLSIFFFLISSPCYSQPSISTVTGTVSNGNSITIAGSGFGTTGPTIVLFDDFEKGSNGNAISTLEGSAQVEQWDLIESAPQNPKYSTAYKHGGSLSLLSDQSTGDGGNWAVVTFPGTTRIYLSYWVFIATGGDVPGVQMGLPNLKLGNISGGSPPATYASDYTTAVALLDLPPGDGGWQGPNPWHDTSGLSESGYGSTTWIKNRWQRYENYYLGSTSGSGSLQMWEMNSANARNRTVNVTGTTIHSGDDWTWFRLHAYAREESNGQVYYDDVYVATGTGALARVEIGNNATYSNCTNLAIITPTSWSDTSIEATVRTGSFSDGTAYLFVINSDGTASSGKEITIGSGGGDTTAPTIDSITTPDPSSITADSLSVTGTASDAVWGDGSVCKWRIGSAPDASNGTACTGTTSWTCSTSGYTRGANTLYVGCGDAVPNWGAGDSITVNFSPTAGGLTAVSGVTIR